MAARIYNFLPVPIHVKGLTETVTVQPGQRSQSISWGTSTSIGIFVTSQMLSACGLLFFGPHAELTGGHYLVVGHEGTEISCELCDSDHHLMHSSSGRAPNEIAKELKGRNSERGC